MMNRGLPPRTVRRVLALVAACVLAAAAPGSAIEDRFAGLAAQDARVARVGYRLASGARALCPPGGRPTGMVVQLAVQYGGPYRALAARAGIGELPTITYVVPASPAALAMLVPGDRIAAIAGRRVAPARPRGDVGDYAAVAATLDLLDGALAGGDVELSVERGGGEVRTKLVAPAGCRARFDIVTQSGSNAYSDGVNVQVSERLAGFARDDGELAAAMAHELAHNILGHARILGKGASRSAVRDGELAADRLSVYLHDAAGYRWEELLGFWSRYGPKSDYGIFSDRTHPGWKRRLAAMTAEHDRIVALRAAGQPVLPPPELAPVALDGDPVAGRRR